MASVAVAVVLALVTLQLAAIILLMAFSEEDTPMYLDRHDDTAAVPPRTPMDEHCIRCMSGMQPRYNPLAGLHPCVRGEFRLPHMPHCEPVLGCDDVRSRVTNWTAMRTHGNVKKFFRYAPLLR